MALSLSQPQVAYGASFVEWFAEEAKRTYGETIPGHLPDKRIHVLRPSHAMKPRCSRAGETLVVLRDRFAS